jgi:hypothetical protein
MRSGRMKAYSEDLRRKIVEATDTDRLMYDWSVLFCLPTGLADEPLVGTGTVMRQQVLRRYAEEADYKGVDVLPIER